jgi:hypothetical protein
MPIARSHALNWLSEVMLISCGEGGAGSLVIAVWDKEEAGIAPVLIAD